MVGTWNFLSAKEVKLETLEPTLTCIEMAFASSRIELCPSSASETTVVVSFFSFTSSHSSMQVSSLNIVFLQKYLLNQNKIYKY